MSQGTREVRPQQVQAMRRSEGEQHDLIHHLKKYAEENPASAALWCFGIGFVLGWKLKPW